MDYHRLDWWLKIGLHSSAFTNDLPLNGLRHPEQNGTSGWYIWAGEHFPTEDTAFEPYHGAHLIQSCPVAVPFLGLPPGYRFLVAPDFEDVWFDPSLLEI